MSDPISRTLFLETAKANGLEPRAYPGYLFEQQPKATTPEEIAALLPMNLKPEDSRITPDDLPFESQHL